MTIHQEGKAGIPSTDTVLKGLVARAGIAGLQRGGTVVGSASPLGDKFI